MNRTHTTKDRRWTVSADWLQAFVIIVVFWQVSDEDTRRIELVIFHETVSHYFTIYNITTLKSMSIETLANYQNFISWQSKLNKAITLSFT